MLMHLELSALYREESHNEPMRMFYIYINIAFFLYGFKNAFGFQASNRYAFEPQGVSTEIKFIFHIQTMSGLVLFMFSKRVDG